MMRLELRCTPRSGRPDLAWIADLTGSLDEICAFLLRAEITAAVHQEARAALGSEEVDRVVDGRAIQLGSPIVRIRDGPAVVELGAQLINDTMPVRALAALALLLVNGPELAAWPAHVKAAWYTAGTDAEQVRQSYQRTTEASIIEVIGDLTGAGRGEVHGSEPESAPPPPVGHRPGRASTDLPTGVRRSTALDH